MIKPIRKALGTGLWHGSVHCMLCTAVLSPAAVRSCSACSISNLYMRGSHPVVQMSYQCNAVLYFLPPLQWARGFVGRLMADPAFVQKLVFEQLMAFSASMYYEWRVRGDQFKKVRAGHCNSQQRLLCLRGAGRSRVL